MDAGRDDEKPAGKRCGSGGGIAARAAALNFNPMPPGATKDGEGAANPPGRRCGSGGGIASRAAALNFNPMSPEKLAHSMSGGVGGSLMGLPTVLPRPPTSVQSTGALPSSSREGAGVLNADAALSRARPAARGRRKPTKQMSAIAATATPDPDEDDEPRDDMSTAQGEREAAIGGVPVLTSIPSASGRDTRGLSAAPGGRRDTRNASGAGAGVMGRLGFGSFAGRSDAGMGHLGCDGEDEAGAAPLPPLRSAMMDVSGSGITKQPSWTPFRCELLAASLSLHSADGVEVATLSLADYECNRLQGNPDAAGCLLLQPTNASEMSKADKTRARAWVRIQTAFDPSPAARGREIDEWKAAFDRARLAAQAEAQQATHALLKASMGEESYLQAVEESRRKSVDGHLTVGEEVAYTATIGGPPTRATLVAIQSAGDDTSYHIRLADGAEVRTIRAKLRPAGGGMAGADDGDLADINRTLSLKITAGMPGMQQVQVTARIHAAGVVVKGGNMIKFVLGRRKQHNRFFKVQGTGMQARLVWTGGHRGRLLKAQATTPTGLQREQRLEDEELQRCFTVVLEGKVLALMAESREEKQQWVDGLNAIAEGLLKAGQV